MTKLLDFVKSTANRSVNRIVNYGRTLCYFFYIPKSSFKELIASTIQSNTIVLLLINSRFYNRFRFINIVDSFTNMEIAKYDKFKRKFIFNKLSILIVMLRRRDVILTEDGILAYREGNTVFIDRIQGICYDIMSSALKFVCKMKVLTLYITLDTTLLNFLVEISASIIDKIKIEGGEE